MLDAHRRLWIEMLEGREMLAAEGVPWLQDSPILAALSQHVQQTSQPLEPVQTATESLTQVTSAVAPQLTVASTQQPILQKGGSETRAGFFGSAVHSAGTWHILYISDLNNSTRSLRHSITTDPAQINAGSVIKDNVETVSAWVDEDGSIRLLGIQKNPQRGSFSTFSGRLSNGTWTFQNVIPTSTNGLETGDMFTAVDGVQILKGHDWSNGNYRRPFFYQGQELQGLVPAPEGNTWYDTYGLSVFEPDKYGWNSDTRYVALQWLFHITDYGSTKAQQFGNIWPVWATSNDLVNWELPWGTSPAFELDSWYSGMVTPFTNPEIAGDTLYVHFGGSSFEHNQFRRTANQVVGTGLSTLSKAAFEEAFYTPPLSEVDPWSQLWTSSGGWLPVDGAATSLLFRFDESESSTRPREVSFTPSVAQIAPVDLSVSRSSRFG